MKIKNNKIDLGMEAICVVILMGITLYLIFNWSSIPERVPLHYDWAGNIDRWGHKTELLILPIMSWFLYLMITGMEQFPKIWNTGVTITEENQVRVYRTLKYMIKSSKLIMILDFTMMDVYSMMGKALPEWFGIVFVGAIFINIIFWLIRLFRVK